MEIGARCAVNEIFITDFEIDSNRSLGKIELTTSGYINNSVYSIENGEFLRYDLNTSISYDTLEEYPWSDLYQNLYNVFDGDKETYASFGANTTENSNGTAGGYICIRDEECIGKYMNIYIGNNIVINFRDSSEEIISAHTANANSVTNNIESIQIPQGSKYIEIYYTGNHLGGARMVVNEIFLTDYEVTSEQTIDDVLQ